MFDVLYSSRLSGQEEEDVTLSRSNRDDDKKDFIVRYYFGIWRTYVKDRYCLQGYQYRIYYVIQVNDSLILLTFITTKQSLRGNKKTQKKRHD